MPIKTNKKPNRNNFYSQVTKALIKIQSAGSGTITFKNYDNSVRILPFSMELFLDERGKHRTFGDIIKILNDLKHDLRAKKWDIA